MERNLIPLLDYIDPAACDYQTWTAVGMALKLEGYGCADWDSWSQRDPGRYHPGECERKWASFGLGAGEPVTGGTIVQLAREGGWRPDTTQRELLWEDEIGRAEEAGEAPAEALPQPSLEPVGQLITYLKTLFRPDERVGYVTESFLRDGKYLPTQGCWDRTAGELCEALSRCGGDLGSVLGDYNPEAGAWIRFNPLDGQGCRNDNVTAFRHALVESDSMEPGQQYALIRQLQLPVACLVWSGGKSLHAIVRVDAGTREEYRDRVNLLYDICRKNGFELDSQNRNPSRLSRMPGVQRGGDVQYLAGTNLGKGSWQDWMDWIGGQEDDLPGFESIPDSWDELPPLAPPLIDGVLRQGHKMLLSGPSKAGKSFALIALAIALAEGREWLGWRCAQGRVLYVNLELDRASCLHRFRDVYESLRIPPEHRQNIDIWNLRGKSVPMDRLAPRLIRRAASRQYIAILIDPIYKVITGDENSASEMAHFCNQFDRVCTELGCAVIYCHHHSKGSQAGKRSMDRASGSGVFARDPDALLDLLPLHVPEQVQRRDADRAAARICMSYITRKGMESELREDPSSGEEMKRAVRRLMPDLAPVIEAEIERAGALLSARTAWRLSGTLREFPAFKDRNLWFDYPVHRLDDGSLDRAEAEGEQEPWQKAMDGRKPKEVRQQERRDAVEAAFEACGIEGEVTVKAMAEYLGVSERTARDHIKEHGDFELVGGAVRRKTT